MGGADSDPFRSWNPGPLEDNSGFRLVVLQPDPDNTDNALWWDALIRSREIEIRGVKHLVEIAEKECAREKKRGRLGKINELLIVGHGTPTSFRVGLDIVETASLMIDFALDFQRLNKSMTKDATVTIVACQSGRDKGLLLTLSALLNGKSVTAPIWDQGPGLGYVHGDSNTCVFTKGCKHKTGWLNVKDPKKDGKAGKVPKGQYR